MNHSRDTKTPYIQDTQSFEHHHKNDNKYINIKRQKRTHKEILQTRMWGKIEIQP